MDEERAEPGVADEACETCETCGKPVDPETGACETCLAAMIREQDRQSEKVELDPAQVELVERMDAIMNEGVEPQARYCQVCIEAYGDDTEQCPMCGEALVDAQELPDLLSERRRTLMARWWVPVLACKQHAWFNLVVERVIEHAIDYVLDTRNTFRSFFSFRALVPPPVTVGTTEEPTSLDDMPYEEFDYQELLYVRVDAVPALKDLVRTTWPEGEWFDEAQALVERLDDIIAATTAAWDGEDG